MLRLILFVIVLLSVGIEESLAAERIALVIGNADYRNGPRLHSAVNDAIDVAAALERLRFSVQLVKNGSLDTLRRSVQDFGKNAAGAEVAAVYFEGHGMQLRDGYWLIPTDAEVGADLRTDQAAISLDGLIPLVSKAQMLGLLILDASLENPFNQQAQLSQRAPSSFPDAPPTEPTNNLIIAFASRNGRTIKDEGTCNSPFTAALLHNIGTPELQISTLFRNVRDEVLRSTHYQQQPFIYGKLSDETISLSATSGAKPIPAPKP